MNDNIPEWRLQGIYQTLIPIFNGTSACQRDLITINRALQIIELGEKGHREMVLDIQSKIHILTRDEYKTQKNQNLQHVSIHCRYQNEYRDGDNATDFTGIVLIEFDDVLTKEVDELKRTLIEYPFVIAAYRSVSCQGVHAWIYCEGVENMDDYKAVWRQLAITFYNNHFMRVCGGSNATTQLVCLSFDPNILYNTNPLPYRYRIDDNLELDYYKTFGKKKDLVDCGDVDFPPIDAALYQHFYRKFIEGKFYWNMILVDKDLGTPVPYANVTYDPDKHLFKKTFSKNIISKCEFRNQSNTVGKWEYKFASLKLSINGIRKVVDGSRKATLISWLSTYAFILRLQGQNISLSELVTLAHVFNDHICYDELYRRSPIVIRHLHFVISNVWAIIQQNKIQPTFVPREHIYHSDIMIECCANAKKESFPIVYFSEIRRLSKDKHKIEVHKKLNLFEGSVQVELIKNINTKKELYGRIADFHKVDSYTARNWINLVNIGEGINEGNHYVLRLILLNITQNDTFSKLELRINQMISNNQSIKQKEVIDLVKKDMSSATVKRHWPKIKERVDIHNHLVKEVNFRPKNSNTNEPLESIQSWVIYRGALKAIIAFNLDLPSPRIDNFEMRNHVVINLREGTLIKTIWKQQA